MLREGRKRPALAELINKEKECLVANAKEEQKLSTVRKKNESYVIMKEEEGRKEEKDKVETNNND